MSSDKSFSTPYIVFERFLIENAPIEKRSIVSELSNKFIKEIHNMLNKSYGKYKYDKIEQWIYIKAEFDILVNKNGQLIKELMGCYEKFDQDFYEKIRNYLWECIDYKYRACMGMAAYLEEHDEKIKQTDLLFSGRRA